jgi:hypothetical protein
MDHPAKTVVTEIKARWGQTFIRQGFKEVPLRPRTENAVRDLLDLDDEG